MNVIGAWISPNTAALASFNAVSLSVKRMKDWKNSVKRQQNLKVVFHSWAGTHCPSLTAKCNRLHTVTTVGIGQLG